MARVIPFLLEAGKAGRLRYGRVVTVDLLSTLHLGCHELRSRLWCGPALATALGVRAGAALLEQAAGGITAALMVRAAVRDDGRSAPREPVLSCSADRAALVELGARLRGTGAHMVVELSHGGPRSGEIVVERPLGPPRPTPDPLHGRLPRPVEAGELVDLIADFERAAEQALSVGAEILALEVAGGNLWQAWLSPLGHPPGTALEIRQAPLVELVRRLSLQAPLVVHLAAEELLPGGLTPSAGTAVAGALARAGASALLVTAGARGLRHLELPLRPPGPLREGRHARLAQWIGRAADLPVGTLGGLRSRAELDRLLGAGVLEFAVLERPFLCEPGLGQAIRSGLWNSACTSGLDCLGCAGDTHPACCDAGQQRLERALRPARGAK